MFVSARVGGLEQRVDGLEQHMAGLDQCEGVRVVVEYRLLDLANLHSLVEIKGESWGPGPTPTRPHYHTPSSPLTSTSKSPPPPPPLGPTIVTKRGEKKVVWACTAF